ncbi:MAG: copper amine oxidase N-terminal domain-containing protein [Clostridiales bacterium]|jgi:hypothetical protein|nr:copper amine oxidase N-terminal domain-containing protein [Clostridiales bacterium]
MRKFLTLALLVLALGRPAFAAEPTAPKNDPAIQIYNQEDGSAKVAFEQRGASYEVPAGAPVRLLLINGGFAADAKIVVESDRTLVPLRIVSENLGAEVGWDGTTRTVTITDGSNAVKLVIGSAEADANGALIKLDAPARIIDDYTYVPLRFIAEALGAEVGYVAKFNDWQGSLSQRFNNATIVTVEKEAGAVQKTVAEGLAAVKAASVAEHDSLVAYYKEIGASFSDENPDYDPADIEYIDKNIGRYFVYRLKGFEGYQVLYNSFTGEIYSDHAGLPTFNIDKGFVNISWLYQ